MYTEDCIVAPHPLSGLRIVNKPDFFPRGFTDNELVRTLNDLSFPRHEYNMLMESPSFAEVDEYYNPGTDDIPEEQILEAIVIDKFGKT